MLKTKNQSILIAAAVLTFGIGILNSIYKRGRLPSFRFFVGNSILWLMLLSLDEFQPEIANALGIGVASFVVLGDGGGVLSHYLEPGRGNEFDTQKGPGENPPEPKADTHGGGVVVRRAASPGPPVQTGYVGLRPLFIPGLSPAPNAIHFPYSGN